MIQNRPSKLIKNTNKLPIYIQFGFVTYHSADIDYVLNFATCPDESPSLQVQKI